MKRLSTSLVSLGAPLLIILALVAVQQRQGRDRVQALPAALVGTGLVISSSIVRRRQRARLLAALRSSRQPSP
ncbi:MAG: hypothetical protein CL863_00575 [Cyanobium sp. RS427]|jgi:hypothetical protein|nr:hypothetical protein [Cyanobium sp. RS427]|tara:strand:+ start:102 stop:320 length:219 start_codon:yes stop_codon:yes gene_type:complete